MYKGTKNAQFALSFSRPPEVSKNGTEAGAMTLGGVERRLHDSPMVHAQLSTSHLGRQGDYFTVSVRAVYARHADGGEKAKAANSTVSHIKLNLPDRRLMEGSAMVGSGTTDTYWGKEIASAFQTAFTEFTGLDYDTFHRTTYSAEQVSTFPTILIQLKGNENNRTVDGYPNVVGLAGDLDPDHLYDVIWAFPPSHYMGINKDGDFIARLYPEGGNTPRFILSANFLMGHDVLFNVSNLQLGLAESNCDYRKLVTDSGFTDALDEAEAGTRTSTDGHEETSRRETNVGAWGSCNSTECRSGLVVAHVIMIGVLYGVGTKLFFRSSQGQAQQIEMAELELSTISEFTPYRDTNDGHSKPYVDYPTEDRHGLEESS